MGQLIQNATNIYTVTNSLLTTNGILSEDMIETLTTINDSAKKLIADFEHHQKESRERLRSYLNHNAMAPLTLIIGYSEILLMDCSDETTEFHDREKLQSLCDYAYRLNHDLVALRNSLS